MSVSLSFSATPPLYEAGRRKERTWELRDVRLAREVQVVVVDVEHGSVGLEERACVESSVA